MKIGFDIVKAQIMSIRKTRNQIIIITTIIFFFIKYITIWYINL